MGGLKFFNLIELGLIYYSDASRSIIKFVALPYMLLELVFFVYRKGLCCIFLVLQNTRDMSAEDLQSGREEGCWRLSAM